MCTRPRRVEIDGCICLFDNTSYPMEDSFFALWIHGISMRASILLKYGIHTAQRDLAYCGRHSSQPLAQ